MKRSTNAIFAVAALCSLLAVTGCGKSKDELLAEGKRLLAEGNPRGAIVSLKNALDKDPNEFAARYELGRAYLESGFAEQAEKELQKVSLQSPDYQDINYLLARLSLAGAKPQAAVEFAKKHLALHPGHADSLALWASAVLQSGNRGEADALYRQSLAADPQNVYAKMGLAGMALKDEQYDRARALVREVLQAQPKHAGAHHLLGTLERKRGDMGAAIAAYEKGLAASPADTYSAYMAGLLYFVQGNAAKARELGKAIEAANPKQPEAALLEGLALFLEKDYKQAAALLQKANAGRRSLAGEYFLGLAHFQLGETELALTQFQRCLDMTPDAATPRLMAAMTLLKQNRAPEAEEQARKLLEIDPANALAYNVLGSSLIARGRFDEGVDALTKATKLDPKLADAHFKKGMVALRRQGGGDEAERELGMAVELAPEVLDTRLILAAQHARDNDIPSALKTLKGGLAGKPGDAVLLCSIARLQFLQNKPSEALESLARAKKANPKFTASYLMSAQYRASQGQFDKTLADFEELLAQDPGNSQALLSAALASRVLGNEAKTAEYLERARFSDAPGSYRPYLSLLLQKGEKDKALAMLEEVIAKRPKDPLPLEDKGGLLLTMGKQAEALGVFQQLRGIAPDRSLFLTVQTHLKAGQNDKAMGVAEDAVAREPEAPVGYMLKALVSEAASDFAAAERALTSGIVRVKKPALLKLALGGLYEKQKSWERAKDLYREMLRDPSSDIPALLALASLHSRRGELAEASSFYDKVLEMQPGNVMAMNNLAGLMADRGTDLKKALALASTAFREDPGNPAILETLGYVLFRSGDLKQAKPLMEKAKELLPKQPTVSYHLALLNKALKDDARAKALLKEALDGGDFPERAEAERLYRQ